MFRGLGRRRLKLPVIWKLAKFYLVTLRPEAAAQYRSRSPPICMYSMGGPSKGMPCLTQLLKAPRACPLSMKDWPVFIGLDADG